LDLGGHVARQLTEDIGKTHDLIHVMEPGHRSEIARRLPQLSGRTILFDHWRGGKGIADPFRKPLALHRQTRDAIAAAAKAWIERSRPQTRPS
ncbi:MAG: low molecular weight phosphotyrosine protein phosphatase, partial [Tabrizicola sp.]